MQLKTQMWVYCNITWSSWGFLTFLFSFIADTVDQVGKPFLLSNQKLLYFASFANITVNTLIFCKFFIAMTDYNFQNINPQQIAIITSCVASETAQSFKNEIDIIFHHLLTTNNHYSSSLTY